MDLLIVGIGILLVFAVVMDILWTSLWIDAGAGPITRGSAKLGWKIIRLVSSGNHSIMRIAGPFILSATVLVWVAGLWTGWLLIFCAHSGSVVSASTKLPADLVERIYFTGYAIFTMGNGDFKPAQGVWQILTAVASGTGLLAITLAITYLLSIVSAGVSARAFASNISSLGAPDQAMARSWDGKGYAPLLLALQTVSGDLARLGQHYLAYPVLQFFHAAEASVSPIVAVAKLEQLLALADEGVPPETRPSRLLVASLESSLQSLLDVLPRKFTQPASQPLPLPSTHALQTAGLPVVADPEFAQALEKRDERRKRIRQLLERHGWSVEDLTG